MLEREVAFHLGVVARDYQSGNLTEDCVYNADESHFVIDHHDGRTLAVRDDTSVKFCDVVGGDEEMTMMVLLGGSSNSVIYPPMTIFQNNKSSYPTRGVADTIPVVCYRSGPKGLIDCRVFLEWLQKSRALPALSNVRKRVLYMDDASDHAITENLQKALRKISTEIRFFPKNATDLCQPADLFLIQKIKTVWRSKWDERRLQNIENCYWTNWKNGSEKLANPEKMFFIQLASDVIRDVNSQRDKDGVLYSRKAMIRCGLSKDLNGLWHVNQFFPHLQSIIVKYKENFDGKPVVDSFKLDGAVTESEQE